MSAAIVLAELGLLVVGRRRPWAIFAAGLLAGYLVWLRYANVGLLLAGLVALTALGPAWRRNLLLYAAGAAPVLCGLVLWQCISFGSPFLTSYDVGWPAGYAKPTFFSPLYLFGEPGGRDGRELAGLARTLALPNAFIYPIQLIGGDAYLILPFVGAVGLFGLVRFARKWGSAAVVGRFGLVVVIATYAMYAPYWYQSARFFQAPVAIEAVAAAALLTAPGLALLRKLTLRLRRPTAAFALAARRPFARV
jgi:hypothetical protein